MKDFSWLDYLEQHEGKDVSKFRTIFESNEIKTKETIKSLFSGHDYVTKAEAKVILESVYIKAGEVPDTLDKEWIKKNKETILESISNLTEGEIKIIINNDISKGSNTPAVTSVPFNPNDEVSIELESTNVKRGRGRPKKTEPKVEEPVTEEIVEDKNDYEDDLSSKEEAEKNLDVSWDEIEKKMADDEDWTKLGKEEDESDKDESDEDNKKEVVEEGEEIEVDDKLEEEVEEVTEEKNVVDNKEELAKFLKDLNDKTRSGKKTTGKELKAELDKLIKDAK